MISIEVYWSIYTPIRNPRALRDRFIPEIEQSVLGADKKWMIELNESGDKLTRLTRYVCEEFTDQDSAALALLKRAYGLVPAFWNIGGLHLIDSGAPFYLMANWVARDNKPVRHVVDVQLEAQQVNLAPSAV